MKNNLYYIPKLSEFHIGFEYEVWDSDIKEYFKWIISDKNELWEAFDEYPLVRIKYLDQSDIESLGWIKHATLENVYFKESQEQNLYGTTYLNINNFGKELLIEDDRTGDYLFKGYIKNKQELIKLMQQLNIC